MSLAILAEGDDYDQKCGEMFLTKYGNVVFHCSLCENKFTGFPEYFDHVTKNHYDSNLSEEDLNFEYTPTTEDDIKRESFEEEYLDDALQEEEVPILVSKENKRVSQVVTNSVMSIGLPALDESEPDALTFKWEEATVPDNDHPKPRLKKNAPKPTMPKPLPKPEIKPISMAEKLRNSNEQALLMTSGVPMFKQPAARGDIPESERKFKCNFCGFAFKDKSNLLAHIKRHSESKNYQCEYCTKMFHTRTEIDDHTRRHTGERPFSCSSCDKTFFTRGELNMHMKRHLNVRNHSCDVCGRRFFESVHLKEHMIVHTQERNHECLVCSAKFLHQASLRAHMKLHANKREYVCELCNASFNQKPGLISHMKRKHKI